MALPTHALMQALRRPRVILRSAAGPSLDGTAPAGPALGLALALALVVATVIALRSGAVVIQGADWLAPWSSEAPSGGAYVLWQLRFPRVLLALGVGAALGLSGALAQALFRNPMADPGLLGVTSGAACAAALALTVSPASSLACRRPGARAWCRRPPSSARSRSASASTASRAG